MNIAEAVQSEATRWDAFIASTSYGSFLQTWAWGEMHRELGELYWRLIIEHNSKIVAVALVLRRGVKLGYSWLYIPRGPVFANGLSQDDQGRIWELLEEKCTSLAKETGAFFIRIDPLWDVSTNEYSIPSFWRKASREVQPMHTLILPLAPDTELLQAKLHSKTRYNIKVAQRKGVTISYSTDVRDVELFLRASREVSARTGFSYHPDEYYRVMIDTLGKEQIAELAIAKAEGEVLAVHIMIYANNIATYAHGASIPSKRSYMAPTLLYWDTILRAKEKGMEQYDFFGIAPQEADPSHPWAGITRMKTGFGGHPVAYVGAYDFVLNEGLYAGFGLMRDAFSKVKNSIRSI
ncbi:MAG TPA: peptidoglycan bridge formation glycyltransferase FemA/FemB family protein [Candidatus Andersenbacteria bacterium]|nr:peptidoglycan bridge formation glycyltransferase FemA/FemB family protein [Candidatus Andersenbacteria bacterium]